METISLPPSPMSRRESCPHPVHDGGVTEKFYAKAQKITTNSAFKGALSVSVQFCLRCMICLPHLNHLPGSIALGFSVA